MMSDEIMLVLYGVLVVIAGAVGWFLGPKLSDNENAAMFGAGIGGVLALAASGFLYYQRQM